MTVFTNPFGAVQTAYVEYQLYDLNGISNLKLFWPTSYQDSPNVVAAYMDIADTVPVPGKTIMLPDAREVSVGRNFIISNIGTFAFDLLDFDGDSVGTIVNGTAWYYILTDNSTSAGIWHRVQYGAGTSSATASDLIGYGVNAYSLPPLNQSRINTQVKIKDISAIPNYAITVEDYTSMLVWTGGTSSIFLPQVSATPPPLPPGQVPPFYYVSINNAGTGSLTLTSADGIQGQLSLSINPGQTLTVITPGNSILVGSVPTKWFTLGYGQPNLSGITVLDKDVSGNADFTLTPSEASNNIHQYSGVLTGNIKIFFPVIVGEWFIYNRTTGPYTLSVQLGPSPGVGTSYLVPQNSRRIFYSDSISMFDIPTDVGTVTSVSANSTTGLNVVVTNPTTTPNITIDLPGGTAGQVLTVNTTGPQTIDFISRLQENIKGLALGSTSRLSPVVDNPDVIIGVNNYNITSTGLGNNVVVGANNLVANTSGANNVAIGIGTLANNTTGANNVAIGRNSALTQNNLINCTFLGSLTDATANNLVSATAIGSGATVGANNSINLGANANVGINQPVPLAGLHLGPSGGGYTPTIYVTGSTVPVAPGVGTDAIVCVTGGQSLCRSGTAKYSGVLVTANNAGTARTAGQANLNGSVGIVIATTAISVTSVVFVTYTDSTFNAGQAGILSVRAIVANTSFTIFSSNNSDSNTVSWMIVNPANIA